MTEPTTTKKVRRKAMTDAGRQMLQRQRQRLNREQAAMGEKLVNEARQAASIGSMLARQNDPVHNAVTRGIVRRVAAVLASEKVRPAIHVSPIVKDDGDVFAAYTDFNSIVVRYTPHADKRLLSATLRGALYHEGGHIRWTTPFTDLRQVMIDQSDDPIYAASGEATPSAYQWAWNALEDQRMETAVVSDSPRKAAYFTPMVLTEMVETPAKAAANWPLLIWRRYLPRNIRRGARKAFVAMHGDKGEVLAQEFEEVVTQYVTATDYATMWDAVCKAVDLFAQHRTAANLNDPSHAAQKGTQTTRREAEKGEKLEIPIDPSMLDESDEDGDEDGQGAAQAEGTEASHEGTEEAAAGDEAGNEAGNEAGTGEGVDGQSESDEAGDDAGESTDEGETSQDGGNGAGGPTGTHTGTDEDLSQKAIDEAISDAEAERLNDSAIEEDVKAYEDALNSSASQLPVYLGGVSKDIGAAAKAENLAAQIQQSFEQATMDREPAWVEQQRRGIVNVNRYVTRQAGDVEYFRNWVEDDQPGYNIAVSVLLDYSGSMSNYTKELAQVAYATKLACWNLGIPCTVTLWDNKAATLFDANESPVGLPIIDVNGSTNPAYALADLDNQRFDKEQHLVLLMTDGQWDHEWNGGGRGGGRTVAYYNGQGRHFIGFGFSETSYVATSYAQNLHRYGIREAYGITDLMAIPKRLQEALVRLA